MTDTALVAVLLATAAGALAGGAWAAGQRKARERESAIETPRELLARKDLTRAERAHTLASLGTDYRKAGFLDRAARAYADALDVDPRNLHALAGQQKLHEEQRQWREG